MRLDSWLVQHNIIESREKAHLEIQAGNIHVNQKVATKAAYPVKETDVVELVSLHLRYVSKGGMKLERAIQSFDLDFEGKTVLDIGASTGGFTDCALQHGAAKVYTIDVGSNQLYPSLRENPKICCYEETDIRHLTLAQLDNTPVDAIVIDVSFISLSLVFPHLAPFLKADGWIVALIKPQFEQDVRIKVKKGIINDARLQQQAILRVKGTAKEHGFHCLQMVETLVSEKDRKNVEFLGLWKKNASL
jgi:23S rRNA (cytidine1920-2'-O)/16S rRNA (cytidine1409-2'-O)-methyltransferase